MLNVTNLIFPSMFHDFLINNLIHNLKSFHSFLFSDSNELLFKRHGTVAVIKEKQTLGSIDSQECRYVLIIRQSSTESNKADFFLGCLNITNCPTILKRTKYFSIFGAYYFSCCSKQAPIKLFMTGNLK